MIRSQTGTWRQTGSTIVLLVVSQPHVVPLTIGVPFLEHDVSSAFVEKLPFGAIAKTVVMELKVEVILVVWIAQAVVIGRVEAGQGGGEEGHAQSRGRADAWQGAGIGGLSGGDAEGGASGGVAAAEVFRLLGIVCVSVHVRPHPLRYQIAVLPPLVVPPAKGQGIARTDLSKKQHEHNSLK